MKYVFIKKFETGETSIGLIDDPLEVYKSGEYKPENGDKIYQLGNEISVEVSVKVKSNTRSDIGYMPGIRGLKDGLDVGEYRG
jgi:hypothetical protein